MPVRLLNSSVLKWPDWGCVDKAVREWVEQQVVVHPELKCVGCFGSYARGDWGVGSDLDLLLIVDQVEQEYLERSKCWDTLSLPVPVDLFVYTVDEWEALCEGESFFRQVRREIVWVFRKETLPRNDTE
jgi:uncharacterized protein